MWEVHPLDEYTKRREKWPKKYKRELLAVHSNLDTFLKALQEGQRPASARFGFIHPEPGGVLAIDQKHGGPHLMETRLYIYPDESTKTVFVITIGNKDSQDEDLRTCKVFVEGVRKGEEQTPSIERESVHVQR